MYCRSVSCALIPKRTFRVQPARCHRDVIVRHRLADRAFSTTAARFAEATPDLKALAAEADVDRVVIGTLLRSGDQLRVVAQLVEAPDGTLLTSHTVQSSLGDLFRLQDDIARRVVAALSLPLTGEAASPTPDAPQNAAAYEFYLRANELARTFGGLARARDLYERCLELDPRFAPAWAHLGRCHRVIGKFVDGTPDSESRAQQAFGRALGLNPRLSVAHKFYANLEGDMGQSQRALVRLLGEPTHETTGAVRGRRPSVSLQWTLGRFHRRAGRSTPARSERPHESRTNLIHDR